MKENKDLVSDFYLAILSLQRAAEQYRAENEAGFYYHVHAASVHLIEVLDYYGTESVLRGFLNAKLDQIKNELGV
jgi:hypothetical protein